MMNGLNGWQRLWSFGAVALLAAVTVPAQTFDDALAAYRRGEFFVAADAFTKLAEQGDAKAQFNLGLMYYKGEGVRQDKFEAARFFRKAAEQGNAEAQANLGILYYNGDGVQQDKAEAARWLRKAAEQGDAEAQSTLRQLARGQTPMGAVYHHLTFLQGREGGCPVPACSNWTSGPSGDRYHMRLAGGRIGSSEG